MIINVKSEKYLQTIQTRTLCAKDLRDKTGGGQTFAQDYLEHQSCQKVVDLWDLSTIYEDWNKYPIERSCEFFAAPKEILELTIRGWRSNHKTIGHLESLLEDEPPIKIVVRTGKQDDLFTFISNEQAQIIYTLSQNPKYLTKEGKLKSTQIAKDYNSITKERQISYREVNTIIRKLKSIE